MGRYAFFNTGVEYKFAFGLQNSTDILKFSGSYAPPDDIDLSHSISWSADMIPEIKLTLNALESHLGLKHFDMTPFENTLEGTTKLKWSFHEHYPSMDEYTYLVLLGYVILHQLSYQPDLYCEFEM